MRFVRKFPKWNAKKILYFIFILFSSVIFADSRKNYTVNVLTWWGYLDKPWVSEYMYQKCGVAISFDEYYSNEEFLKRFRENDAKYDVIIFAEPLYKLVENEITNKGVDISNVIYQYNKHIKNNYLKRNYPKNLVYFAHSVTGVLWNPDIIKINKDDDIKIILKKSQSNLVVMIDDPVEARLVTKNFTVDSFIQMTKSSRVFITNNFNQLDNKNNLAFSYLWSGEAFSHLVKYKNRYKFAVNPRYSFFSSDLIAALNKSSHTTCIARAFASKDFLDKLQEDTFYISPYADLRSIKDADVKMFYQNILRNMSQIRWIKPLSKDEFYKSNQAWKYIKLYRDNQKNI